MTNIILDSNITLQEIQELKNKAKQWAINNTATEKFIDLAEVYWKLYKECGNVNPLIGYVQAAYKTSFGNYSEKLKEQFNNPCGLKDCTEIDDNELNKSYIEFTSIEDGVSAHLDHLALYAGGNEYPKEKSKDKRHFSYLCGVCKYIEDLSTKWEPEENYSSEILKLMNEVYNTKVKDNIKDSSENKIRNKESITNSLANDVEKDMDILDKIQGLVEKLQIENNNLKKENESLKNTLNSYKDITKKIMDYVNTLS